MPTYRVTDPDTGRKIKMTGPEPPTEQEILAAFSAVKPNDERVAFMERVAPKLQERGEAIKEAYSMPGSPSQLLYNRPGLRIAGNIIGGVSDVGTETVKSLWDLLPEGFRESHRIGRQKIAQTGAGQAVLGALGKAGEYVSGLAHKYPEATKDVEAMMNIASVVPAFKGAQLGTKAAGAVAREGIDMASDVSKLAVGKGATDVVRKEADSAIKKYYRVGIRPVKGGRKTPQQLAHADNQRLDSVMTIAENKENLQFVDDIGDVVKGQTPQTVKELSQAVEQTKEVIFKQYDDLAKSAGASGVTIDVNKAVDAALESLKTPSMQRANPRLVRYAEKRAKELKAGKPVVAPLEAQTLIKDLNATISKAGPNVAIDKTHLGHVELAFKNAIKKATDDAIELAEGPGYSELKRKYSALLTTEKEITNKLARELNIPTPLWLDFSNALSAGGLLTGIAYANPKLAGAAVGSRILAKTQKYWRSPNRQVKLMFETANRRMELEQGFVPKSKTGKAIQKAVSK